VLHLSQQGYSKKVVEKLKVHESRPVGPPLSHHTKLLLIQALSYEEDRREMKTISY